VRDEGSVLWLGWSGLAVCALVLLLVLDLTAYLVAAARAQTAADAAALAAVASVRPHDAAQRTARANGAELLACICPRAGPAAVVVAVDVRAVAVTRFAARRATARSRAHLVRDNRKELFAKEPLRL
jgi:putative Flp pilus-assembly TadE/G-like protein